MKKLTVAFLAAVMCFGTLAGCGSKTTENTTDSNATAETEAAQGKAENVHLDTLNVYFVPSRDPQEIVTATEPLSGLLKTELAGPSEKGKELADKVNSGEDITWDDLNSANWSVMSSSSPAGYIYPSLWLQDKYGKGITDLSNAVQADSYASAFARLASGQVDVLVTYADARRDYEENWTTEFGRTDSIWQETNVIGVTDPIYNDTVCVSKNSPNMDDNLKKAIQTAMINIGNTEEGKQVISIYSHNGYQPAQSSDYDKEREAQKLIQQLNAGN